MRTHRYTSDRPNKPPAPDLLGRDRFAERLADDIRAWDGSDSIVIALFGSWGSGKTSLKERVVANLREADSEWPILDFNPWQFSGSGSITIPFFRELDTILKTGRAGKDSEEASVRLKRYSSRLSLLGTIARFAAPLGLLHSTEAAAGAAAAADAFEKMAHSTQQGGQALDEEVAAKTATDIKKELSEAMDRLDRSILVVVDDIDRLTTAEILEVFQLVKVNADLPNIIYLLLFDRPVVSKALDKVSEGRGGQYLEKIVQVAYHIPQARPDKIREVLFAGIDEILGANDAEVRWNVNRWSDVYLEGMELYFRNLRHAYRFLGSLNFHVGQFRKPDGFEVNPIDLIALETLRIFEPDLYERLFQHKSLLVGKEERGLSRFVDNDGEDEQRKAAFDDLMANSGKETRTFAEKIIGNIFPLCVRGGGSTSWAASDSEEWLRDARVCHRDIFDRYFVFDLAELDLSHVELEQLIATASDHAKFARKLANFSERGLLQVAMERMDAYKSEIPTGTLPELVLGLCDFADFFPERAQGRVAFDPLTFAWRLAYFGLKRVKTTAQRSAILTQALKSTEGVVLPVMIVDHEERTTSRRERAYEFLLDEEQLAPLKEICVEKLREAARNGSLRAMPDAETLLWRWREWTTPEEVRLWVTDQCRRNGAIAWFLSTMLGAVSSGAKRYPYITLSTLEAHIDLDLVKSQVDQLSPEQLSVGEQEAVTAFRRAWTRKLQGKPELTGQSLFRQLDEIEDGDNEG